MNGAEYVKKKVTKLLICRYWKGIGVVTTRSQDLSEASTSSHSRYKSNAARSHTWPSLRWCSTMDWIWVTTLFARFWNGMLENSATS